MGPPERFSRSAANAREVPRGVSPSAGGRSRTMAIDTFVPRTRRSMLAASLGGLIATVAGALGRPEDVRAGIDGDVVLGVLNSSAALTTIDNQTPNVGAF